MTRHREERIIPIRREKKTPNTSSIGTVSENFIDIMASRAGGMVSHMAPISINVCQNQIKSRQPEKRTDSLRAFPFLDDMKVAIWGRRVVVQEGCIASAFILGSQNYSPNDISLLYKAPTELHHKSMVQMSSMPDSKATQDFRFANSFSINKMGLFVKLSFAPKEIFCNKNQ
ncbi:hypothetical protein PIB30_009206 [Stylosanthes scabra]|uniref:Uncharacterized protein n=1 Tax=Stylosanthes scabra TaxID=79078 RepID=A0ABU6Z5N4_9FABA|nr:hypothetical protein [Stylosanthes scabra]